MKYTLILILLSVVLLSSCYKTQQDAKFCWTCTINQRTYSDSASVQEPFDSLYTIQKCNATVGDIQTFEQQYTLVGTVNIADSTGKVYTYQVADLGASCVQN
ncbi:MAG: hypothetical protein P4L41_10825 [Flavipsychrobacter sp.]|nr:hypothetical protein [Flavipsychrobacter sp.]